MTNRAVTALVVCVLVSPMAAVGTASATEVPAPRSVRAQIFATNNTATISDPTDPRLRTRLIRFERRVREIIRANGAGSGRSALLDGVFWSESLRRSTYERSREFDVTRVSPAGLRHIADVVRKTYHQKSVLTFEYLPKTAPRADAVEIEVPGAGVRRLNDGLVADPDARARLGGGSITMTGRLILVAARTDLSVARRLVTEIGGTWSSATVRYGAEEFVGGPAARPAPDQAAVTGSRPTTDSSPAVAGGGVRTRRRSRRRVCRTTRPPPVR